MALNISTAVLAYRAAQYDGTNGGELLEQLNSNYVLVSDTGSSMTFTDVDQVPHTINSGEWMLWRYTDLVGIEPTLPSLQYAVL